jgi:lysine 2,3-aminomutase
MRTLRSIPDLVAAGLAPAGDTDVLERVAAKYAVAVTPSLASLVLPGADDPIARQFVPSAAELVTTEEERVDPIGDAAHSPVKGIVHRYPDRVLLKLVSVCPVYCRFCFRREMVGPGKDDALTSEGLAAAIAYIRAHPEIWEVILTGGDPFMASPRRAREVTQALETIAHVKVIRWHTRMPVADPERIDDTFVAAIRSTKPVYVAIHANHPRELQPAMRAACARMADAGIVLLGQSVLLRGVNDDAGVLEELMRGLVETRVRPYYLHHPDLAPGTSHFRLSLEEGRALVRELRDRVSGLCQPDYVIDIPGGVSKALAAASDVEVGDSTRVRGRDGDWRTYPPES